MMLIFALLREYGRVGQLFEELKRRNVVRVGVAYLVMGWIIMQIVDVLAQTLVLPDWREAAEQKDLLLLPTSRV